MKYPQLSLRETNAPYMEEMKTIAAEVIEGGCARRPPAGNTCPGWKSNYVHIWVVAMR